LHKNQIARQHIIAAAEAFVLVYTIPCNCHRSTYSVFQNKSSCTKYDKSSLLLWQCLWPVWAKSNDS